jgi:PAS domain S-box-containing protein
MEGKRTSRGGEGTKSNGRSAEFEDLLERAGQEIRQIKEALEQRTRELADAVALLRASMEATTDGVLVTDEEGALVHVNTNYLAMWKMAAHSLEGGTAVDMRDLAGRNFADPGRFLSRVAEITAGSAESFDVLELEDGRVFERFSKVISVEGRQLGRVWNFYNATPRHLSEITAHRLAAIVTSSDDAIIGKDLNSVITSWNYAAERIFGYTAEEIIGMSIMRLIPFDRQEEEREILSRIRNGERVDHFETVRLAKDGRRLNVSITVSPIKDSAGHVIGASKVARDITERKRAEAALKRASEEAEEANRQRLRLLESEREARSQAERASRLKDEFLATLSHELRTPLNTVVGWARLLQSGKLAGDELSEGLKTIERNARIQAEIIEDLLDMSRIISGKVRLEMRQMDLPTVLNASIETLRGTAKAKAITLQSFVDSDAGTILGDSSRLQQVFGNLLSNAIKFTPNSGKIQVSAKRVKSHVEIRVSDTGEGIDPEFLPYVFDRFHQADASTTRRHGGLGLGLSIVKQLVELHGGYIRAESDGLEKGSTFMVHLPLVAVYSEPGNERRHPEKLVFPEQLSLRDVHVLVVDDQADARELIKRLLEMAGAIVSIASSASEARERIFTVRPNVLVCDIGMPDEDGYSFIRKLRVLEQSQNRILPAVALTAYARSEDRTRAIACGFQYHLAKPVDPTELLTVVSSLAGRIGTNSPEGMK